MAGATSADAKPGEEDLSMEEILQSIRKIIAEDEGDGKKPGESKVVEAVPGSDVLELTEMIKDDGSIVSLKPEPARPETPPVDVLNQIDEALAPAAPVIAAPVKPPEPQAAAPTSPQPAIDTSLLSAEAASAATQAFKKLKTAEPDMPSYTTTPAPAFRSGATVEDMVTDMLTPMMKAWLDANLPAIVERIVEREVKKLTR
jgi:cell pole-organizing protein PopZ